MSEPAWAEVGPESAREAHEALARELASQGHRGPVEFLPAETEEEALAAIASAKARAVAIRVAQRHAFAAAKASDDAPAMTLSLGAADWIERSGGRWWPRNSLFEGAQRSIARDLGAREGSLAAPLDLSAAILVLGATAASRAAVAALVRVGFGRFNFIDPSAEAAALEARRLRRAFFRAKFESTSVEMASQLPGVHGVVVNGLEATPELMAGALSHMNYLAPRAAWLELFPGPSESALLDDAVGAGALVEPGSRVCARADAHWCAAALKVQIDPVARAAVLQAIADKTRT